MAIEARSILARNIRDLYHNSVIDDDHEDFQKVQRQFTETMESNELSAYLDGIPHQKEPAKFMKAKHFYSLPIKEQNRLEEECKARQIKNGKKPIGYIVTVGIGANINSSSIRDKYDELLNEKGFMDRVARGEMDLSPKQSTIIFNQCIKDRVLQLKKDYGTEVWSKLRMNEKIVIIDLYFNAPSLCRKGTDFHTNIVKYTETNDEKYLRAAIYEVKHRSNRNMEVGIQNRRNAQAILLSSHECPAYTRPNETPDGRKATSAKLNHTIIPMSQRAESPGINSKYFIWRTKGDGSVRAEHVILDGRVFKKDSPPGGIMPGEDWGCRCKPDEVPDEVLIIDQELIDKAFNLYLRKGISKPYIYLSKF